MRSLLHSWDVPLKISAFFVLMMSMAFVRKTELLPLLPGIALFLALFSGLPWKLFLSRLKSPAAFLLFMGMFLTVFSTGDITARMGPVPIRISGAEAAMGITVRVISMISVGIVMVHTTKISAVSTGLRRIKFPALLVDMGILTGRYIMVIGEDYRTMRTARTLRGYSPHGNIGQFFRVIVPATGTLLIRGFQRSETVFNAMRLRGYCSGTPAAAAGKFKRKDVLLFLAAIAISALLVVLELAHGS